MFCSDARLIYEIARSRLSHSGHILNLDMNDYDEFALGRSVICAVGLKSEKQFAEFLDELRKQLHNVQCAVDQPSDVLIHLLAHPQADMTMANYSLLSSLFKEFFGDSIKAKIGYATDDNLPSNYKDIMVFVAGQ